ncbi:MAG: TIGR02391 family protein [Ignavibacteria bacterium]|nr:TIGR02391 family protein [Ignavibacteria bacterium]
MNIRHIATQFGDRLKYDTSVNEIDRIGQSILRINKDSFPNNSITSVRAQTIYNWIMSLGNSPMSDDERTKRLVQFCLELTPDTQKGEVAEFLEKNGCSYNIVYKDSLKDFYKRNFHEEIIKHSKKLFLQGNYFHAVFESAKAFNNAVKNKSFSDKDGEKLMMEVFSLTGVLKINSGQTETERNVQDGIKFLSSGLMRAVRNPTAHEPALDWSINKQECLDLLSMISFLYKQLDRAVYYKAE